MKLSKAFGYALLGTCLYGAVMNSFPTNEEKDAVGEIDATNEVECVGCAAVMETYGFAKTMTEAGSSPNSSSDTQS